MTVFAWVGLIVASAVSLGATFAGCVAALVALRDRRERRGMIDATRLIGNDLIGNGWWFSEHPPTMNLLQEYGRELQRLSHSRVSIDEFRVRWRKRMEELVHEFRKAP